MFRPSSHSITISNATLALKQGLHAIQNGETEIDLSSVVVVDSVAVATLLAWQCAAKDRGISLYFSHLPSNLESLINLYGVTQLLSKNP